MAGVSKARGFTLVEMLIASSLFVLAMGALTDIYASFYKIHRKVSNQAVLSQEMRYALEYLVRQTRQRSIVYPALPGALAGKLSTIELAAENGTRLRFGLQSGAPCQATAPGVQCLAISEYDGTVWGPWYPLTGGRTNVTRFDVYARPLKNPFELSGGVYDNDVQPMVTYVLGLTYLADNPTDNQSLGAQTSVSLRLYPR